MWVNKKEKEMEMEMEKGRVECREKIGTTRKVMMLNKRGERQKDAFQPLSITLTNLSPTTQFLHPHISTPVFLFCFFFSFFL